MALVLVNSSPATVALRPRKLRFSRRYGLGTLGAPSSESHPEIVEQAQLMLASYGFVAECKEELINAASLGGYYNRTCRMKCASGQWTPYMFGADQITIGQYTKAMIEVDLSHGCGTASSGGTSSGTNNPPPPPPATVVVLSNTSRPGQAFQAGDSYRLTVTGAPNATVTGSATQNGKSLGTTEYGTTSGSGVFALTGKMEAVHIGTWSQVWRVGGVASSTLTFTVSAAPSSPPPTDNNTSGSGNTGGNNNSGGNSDSGANQDSGTQGNWTDFWKKLVIGGPPSGGDSGGDTTDITKSGISSVVSSMPWWAWIALAGGGYLIGNQRKR